MFVVLVDPCGVQQAHAAQAGPNAPAPTEAAPSGDTVSGANSGTNSGTSSGTNSGANSGSNSGSNSGAHGGFDSGADSGIDSKTGLPLSVPVRISQALRKGDKPGALKLADDFLATHARDAQVRFLRAVILGDMGRVDDAAAALEALTQDFPELAEPYNNLAVLRANQGQLATAEHYLQLAITAQPNYVTARENLGDLYLSMAASSYEQAARLEPGSAVLKKKLALTRELGGKLRNAR